MTASSWWHEAKSPRSTDGLRGGVTGGVPTGGYPCWGVPAGGVTAWGCPREGVPRSGPLRAPRMLLAACGQ